MGAVTVVFYRGHEGVPALGWLEGLAERVFAKGVVRIGRPAELGHELRRPECDYLGDGIYELRWRLGRVNYRLLYFFHGRDVVVLAHGTTKEAAVPRSEIDLALKRRTEYLASPEERTHYEDLK